MNQEEDGPVSVLKGSNDDILHLGLLSYWTCHHQISHIKHNVSEPHSVPTDIIL
jgi:hypothetical protein